MVNSIIITVKEMEVTMEKWKNIKNYEGFYQVSNCGKVKSLKRTVTAINGECRSFNERMLTLHKSKPTERHPVIRYHVELWKDNKRKVASIHRLVSEHFVPNPQGKPQVNHIDGDPSNNHYENLEWVTNSENMKHAYATGLTKPRNNKPIKGTNLKTDEELLFDSVEMAARHFGCWEGAIRSVLKGRSKTSCGFHWQYQ